MKYLMKVILQIITSFLMVLIFLNIAIIQSNTQVIDLIDSSFYPTIVFEGEGLSNTYSQSSYLRYYIMGPTFYLYHGNGITYNGIGIVDNKIH